MFDACRCMPETPEMGAYTPIPKLEVTSQEPDKHKSWKDLEITLSESVRDFLTMRAGNCFLCAWTLKDLEKNGKLTNYPLDYNGSSIFPRTGKESHLKLEGLEIPNDKA